MIAAAGALLLVALPLLAVCPPAALLVALASIGVLALGPTPEQLDSRGRNHARRMR